MPPPPSPASSTCSDTTVPSTSQKRAKKNPALKEGHEKKDEEEWNLKDVVFVEDSKNVPMGRVLKIDGAYAVIKFTQNSPPPPAAAAVPSKEQPAKEEDVASILQDCRLLRLDDLQLVKNGTLPKSPDCIQKSPRKVHLSEISSILALSVDAAGIHGVVRDGKKLTLKAYNLHSGKAEVESQFPSDIFAFLGTDPTRISLNCSSDNEFMSILRDGNGTLYPLIKDCLDAIRDPLLVDLPPITCIGTGIHALPHVGSQQKNQVGVLVMAIEQPLLMSKILKCDVEGVRQVLTNLDHETKNKMGNSSQLNKVLLERCDGNRNVFHAVVSMTTPTSNKDVDVSSSTSSTASTATPTAPVASSNSAGAGAFGSLDSTIENLASVLSSTTGMSNITRIIFYLNNGTYLLN
jgi:E3 ubiquitin-protein ligase EDD1